MTRDEHIRLLRAAYWGWRDSLDTHSDLGRQVAAGVKVPKDRISRVRQELDRTLRDFIAIGAQVEATPLDESLAHGCVMPGLPALDLDAQMKYEPVYLPDPER